MERIEEVEEEKERTRRRKRRRRELMRKGLNKDGVMNSGERYNEKRIMRERRRMRDSER